MTVLWAGLTMGSVYTLVALTYNMTLVLTGVLNFATAQFFTVGAFTAYAGLTQHSLPLPVVLLIGAVLGGLVAVAEERVAIRPLRGHGGHTELVTTLGVSTVIAGAAIVIWGPDPLRVTVVPERTWTVLGGQVRPNELLLIVIAVVATLGFHVWTHRSRLGLAGLARTEDEDAAALRGIDVRRLSMLGFAIAGIFGGLVGPVMAQTTYAVATIGLVLALKGFVAMALGGVGSHLGALLGGTVVGLVEAFSNRHLGNDYGDIAVIVILALILLLRPTGLLSKGEPRLV
ncbi:branched-chain amino acid ABC transporter permease [Actinomadura sp. LD22]|uniref:Branched-chain amino acid ABC transporter permease n=1 Tax=Actinomadura physcomitrii TaxID=2650748 RepID=A0A6I4MF50_9ACTN|nr:branched-chain amino acid ABC transporter permease [Actinomadura physcomitrii]MWA03185.1 branched-chain amino acid ABC transporter permease [Actinomadura physcomitrii]